MMQEHWPFECAVRGVVTRDMLGSDECPGSCGRAANQLLTSGRP